MNELGTCGPSVELVAGIVAGVRDFGFRVGSIRARFRGDTVSGWRTSRELSEAAHRALQSPRCERRYREGLDADALSSTSQLCKTDEKSLER